MRKEGLPLKRLMSHESLTLAAEHFKLADVSALYAAVGEGNLSAQAVVRRVIELHGGDDGRRGGPRRGRHHHRAPLRGAKVAPAATPASSSRARPTCGSSSPSAAPRCRPTTILGFVTKGGGVSVHRTDCTNAAELRTQPEKLLDVEWAPTGSSTFLVNIQVEALDRARLLSDITMVLSDAHVNILQRNLSTTRDRVAKTRFTFEMAEAKHLDTVLKAVRTVPGVFDAYRVTQ